MTKINDMIYLGVDIAKLKIDICLLHSNYSDSIYETYSNDMDGFFELFSLISSVTHLENIRIGMEATSVYMVSLQKFLDSQKIKYILINPKKIHHYKKYKNFESKTDKLDSYYIADYITTLEDKSFNSHHSKVKEVYKAYQGFMKMIKKYETHMKGLQDSILSDDFTNDTLKKEIINIKNAFKKTKNVLQTDLLLTAKLAMPEYEVIEAEMIGVGDETMLAVMPLIYEIVDVYSLKQLQSFIGLNPLFKESGSSLSKKQKISKAGNPHARKMLYMSAVASIKHNSDLKLKYKRLISNGKSSKEALVAISAHIFRGIVKKLRYYKNLKS